AFSCLCAPLLLSSSLSLLFTVPSPPLLHTLSLHDALPILPPLRPVLQILYLIPLRSLAGFYRALYSQTGQYNRDAPEISLHIYRSEEHTSELQSRFDLVCRLLLEKKNINYR